MLGAKRCECCEQVKSCGEFFAIEGVAGVSRYCQACHAAGKIKHGYGYYGDRYQSPQATTHRAVAGDGTRQPTLVA